MRGVVLAAVAAVVFAGVLTLGLVLRAPAGELPSHPPEGPYRGSEPPARIELPRFALPRYDGSGTVRSRDLRGKVVLTTFVDSACKESCPVIVGILGKALRRLTADERRRLVAVAISVDPQVDTRRHVRRFLADRRALGQLDYLVAPVGKMTPIWKRFGVLSAAETGNADFHSADVRIFDPNGVWVSTMNLGPDLSIANVVHDIRRALEVRQA